MKRGANIVKIIAKNFVKCFFCNNSFVGLLKRFPSGMEYVRLVNQRRQIKLTNRKRYMPPQETQTIMSIPEGNLVISSA